MNSAPCVVNEEPVQQLIHALQRIFNSDSGTAVTLTLSPSASASPEATLGTGWNLPLNHAT